MRRFVFFAVLVGFLTLSVFATQTQKEFSLPADQLSFDSSQPLTVNVTNLGDKGVVAIRVSGSQSGILQISAFAAILSDPEKTAQTGGVDDVVSLLPAGYQITNNTIDIDGQASPNRVGLVYLRVAVETDLTLYNDGNLIRQGPITEHMLVVNGQVDLSAIGPAFEQGVSEAMSSGLTLVPKGSAKRMRHPEEIWFDEIVDAYHLPWKTLETLAVLSEKPELPDQMTNRPNLGPTELVAVFVKKNGTVKKVVHAAGDRDVTELAISSLSGWQFKPFLVDGEAVSVYSYVKMRIEGDELILY